MCPQAVFCTALAWNSRYKAENIGLGLFLHCPAIIQFEKASYFPRKGLEGQATNIFRSQPFSGKLLKKIRGRAVSSLLTDQVSQADKSILVAYKDVWTRTSNLCNESWAGKHSSKLCHDSVFHHYLNLQGNTSPTFLEQDKGTEWVSWSWWVFSISS